MNKAANQGLSQSQYYLALLYEHGNGVPQDDAEAFSWCLKAANQGHAEAQYELGIKYLYGAGVEKDIATAYRWISKAADQDDPDALYQMGRAYHYGYGDIEIDETKSISLYTKAADQGLAEAQHQLGLEYLYSFGDANKDPSKAIDLFVKAAKQGYAEAQFQLGYIYQYGIDLGIHISKDYDKAVFWHRQAADQDNPGSQSSLADMYAKGHGVKQSDENAVFWYSKAAVQGDKHSQEQLSLAHKDGKGVKKDLNLSVYWQMKCDLNNDGDVIDGRLLDISLSAGLIEFIAHNLREAPDFNNVTTIQFKSYEISDDVISGFAKLILTNSPLKNLEISTEKDPGEKNFLILVNALESNIQLTDLSVKVLFTGMKINEKLAALLARNVAIAELRKYVQDHRLKQTPSFPLNPLNIIIDEMIVSYMMRGKSKDETKNAIDELLRDASFYELEADVKNQVKQ